MDDYIRRIDALKASSDSLTTLMLKMIPSADVVERKRGEWIRTDYCYFSYCSVCGFKGEKTNYCPNCGAKMDGGK